MNNRDKIIQQIVQIANERYPDSEIFLYGSQARGEAKQYSDWDLLVLLDQKNIPFDLETKIMDDYYDLEIQTGEVISPMIYTKDDWYTRYVHSPLYENIEKEGIKIK